MEMVTEVQFDRFVVEDKHYNYISARFPGDVELMSKRIVDLMRSIQEQDDTY